MYLEVHILQSNITVIFFFRFFSWSNFCVLISHTRCQIWGMFLEVQIGNFHFIRENSAPSVGWHLKWRRRLGDDQKIIVVNYWKLRARSYIQNQQIPFVRVLIQSAGYFIPWNGRSQCIWIIRYQERMPTWKINYIWGESLLV